jgi:glycerol-3-phosphate dehydrogenase
MTSKRTAIWQSLTATPDWDVVIIGGGITGAGILREAARAGLRALLLEQRDFAWGTSSRSSKIVHGGLRYLKQGQLGVMYQSVRQRENLLKVGAGLITPLGFLMPTYEHDSSKWLYKAGLSLYDMMAGRWGHRQYGAEDFALLAPHISRENLDGGFYFEDAQTDDARLVLRLLQEAVEDGGVALNYARVEHLLKDDKRVIGVTVRDAETQTTLDIRARVVMNATGAWVDKLRAEVGGEKRMRPLRGSHLLFPAWRFPVAQAVSFAHPLDGRPVFAYPWEDMTLVGTTDVDHDEDLNQEPRISGDEAAYLMAACNMQFPELNLTLDDVVATYAGVRPVVGTGKVDPSKEAREHIVWLEDGLLSVTGGKLTIFRVIALDALKAAQAHLPEGTRLVQDAPALNQVELDLPDVARAHLTLPQWQRLVGRYGSCAVEVVNRALPDELSSIAGTHTLWAELRWAAYTENVVHLEDLLLRRTRLGLTLPQGGMPQMERIRQICGDELNWDTARWDEEITAYQTLWQQHYSLPARETIPDWRTFMPDPTPVTEAQPQPTRAWLLIAAMLAVGILVVLPALRKSQRAAPHAAI